MGNIRTALFDHLFAEHHGGVNILRIEDTDRTRYVPGCEEEIEESLRYVGVEWQEGPDKGGPFAPYRQSERKAAGIYDEHVARLLELGAAYKAFDTSEELAEMRAEQERAKQPIGYYGGQWRDATLAKVEAAEGSGRPYVVRLRVPRNETIGFEDAIRGHVEVDSNTVDDPVLIKADGMPTYHFAAMVDDHLMEITHVFRGEEWISSAPKHIVMLKALGWEPPVLVHVPVIKGKDGSKLSKRHGDTACLDFRRSGYLPEALANFIALIGWSPGGDRELMSMKEMAEAFDLGGIQPSPGVFDLEKLQWMNGNYIRALELDDLYGRLSAYVGSDETVQYWSKRKAEEGKPVPQSVLAGLKALGAAMKSDEALARDAVRLEQERVIDLAGFGEACAFFFDDAPPMDAKAVEKWMKQAHVPALVAALEAWLSERTSVSHDDCEAFVRGYAETAGFEKVGPIVHPTRVALTGKTVGPGLFELMAALGPQRMLRRLQRVKEIG